MKVLMGILLAMGAAALLPGCAGTVHYGAGYGYEYDHGPFYSPGYYTYNYEHPTHRPYESYHFHPILPPPVRRPIVTGHGAFHIDGHNNGGHDGIHGQWHATER